MSTSEKANRMLRGQVMYLCTQRSGWTANTHMRTLLEDIRDDNEASDRELALAIEWLKMLPLRM